MESEGILNKSGDVLSQIGNRINEFFSDLRYSISNFWQEHEIAEKLREFWNKISEWAKNGLNALKNGLHAMANGFVSLGNKLKKIGGKVFDSLKSGASQIMNNVKNFTAFLGQRIVAGVEWFKENFSNLRTVVKEKLKLAFENTKKFIYNVGQKSRDFFANISTKVKQFSTNFVVKMKEFKKNAGKKWKEFSAKIKDVFENSKAKIIAGTAVVATADKSGLDKFKDNFAKMKENVANKLKDFKAKFTENAEERQARREANREARMAKREADAERKAEEAEKRRELAEQREEERKSKAEIRAEAREERKRKREEAKALKLSKRNNNIEPEFVPFDFDQNNNLPSLTPVDRDLPSTNNFSHALSPNDRDNNLMENPNHALKPNDPVYGFKIDPEEPIFDEPPLHEIQEGPSFDKSQLHIAPKNNFDFSFGDFGDDENDITDAWKLIKFQMNRTKFHSSLEKSFNVENFINTMDKIIYVAKDYIEKNDRVLFENLEECLAYIPTKYPELKEDVLMAYDALDKLSTDLNGKSNKLNDLDKQNIGEFLNLIDYEGIGLGFDLDNYKFEPSKDKKEPEDNSLADIGANIIDSQKPFVIDMFEPNSPLTKKIPNAIYPEELEFPLDTREIDKEPEVRILPHIQKIGEKPEVKILPHIQKIGEEPKKKLPIEKIDPGFKIKAPSNDEIDSDFDYTPSNNSKISIKIARKIYVSSNQPLPDNINEIIGGILAGNQNVIVGDNNKITNNINSNAITQQ